MFSLTLIGAGTILLNPHAIIVKAFLFTVSRLQHQGLAVASVAESGDNTSVFVDS
jgi:hypothetical protein